MATFSPTPASRRVSRAPGRGHSPTRRSYGGRAAYTPGHLVHDTASLASAMDVDERSSVATDKSFSRIGGDLVFSRTEEMSVSYYASLPLEVKQVLKTSGASINDHRRAFLDNPKQTLRGITTRGRLTRRLALHSLLRAKRVLCGNMHKWVIVFLTELLLTLTNRPSRAFRLVTSSDARLMLATLDHRFMPWCPRALENPA